MHMLTKGKFMNCIKISQGSFLRAPSSFYFSFKNESEKETINDFSYEYNKYNAQNISFDKEKSKEIEKSFGKIIERYEENNKWSQEAKKIQNETCKMKPIYKYSSCDYIPRIYIEGKKKEEKNIDENLFDE